MELNEFVLKSSGKLVWEFSSQQLPCMNCENTSTEIAVLLYKSKETTFLLCEECLNKLKKEKA